jgi:hypothetical protein
MRQLEDIQVKPKDCTFNFSLTGDVCQMSDSFEIGTGSESEKEGHFQVPGSVFDEEATAGTLFGCILGLWVKK